MSTTCEQLEGAALALARSGSIKDRLAEAFRTHLASVDVAELPEALRAQFRACHEALTRERPLRGEDAVRATVRKMSGLEADEVASRIVQMFAAVVREQALEAARQVAREPIIEPRPAPEPALPPVAAVASNGRGKRKTVPQVISLYAADAQSSLNSIVSQRVVSS